MGSIIRVEAPDRHPQRLLGIVVAGPAYHPRRTGLGRLAAVIRAVGVGAILAGRPLPQVAEEVLGPRRSGARRALVAPLGRVVGTSEHRVLRSGRVLAPGIAAPVRPPRRPLPLRLGGQPPAAPEAGVAGSVPGGLHGRVVLETGVGNEAAVAAVDAGVGVAGVEVVRPLGAPEPARLEEERDLPVRDLVPIQPEVADEHAVERPLVGGAVAAAHPERAGLDEHDPVGAGGPGRGRAGPDQDQRGAQREAPPRPRGHAATIGGARGGVNVRSALGAAPGDLPGSFGYGDGAMNSRWSDADAQGRSELDLLVYASRLIGAETTLVVWGGGNTSVKQDERDHRNRPTRVLRVKGSGSDLKSIATKDFPGVRMDDVLALLERQDMGDQEMVDYLAHALQEPSSPRPSIETLLHGFLPATAVIHTHADAVVSLTNNDRSRDVLREVYGDEVIPLAYRRPGFLISREVAQTFAANPKARALLLEKHGTICWGATVKEAYLATIELISRAEEAIAHRARGRARFGGAALASPPAEERRRVALAVVPHLRGLVGRDRRQVLFFDDAPDLLEFAGSREAEALCRIGPATPDHTIFTKRLPCFAPVENPADPESVRAGVTAAVERFVADYTAYFEAHNTGGAKLTDPFPRVVVVGGLGLFATGKDRRTAGIVNDIYHHTISVLGAATSFGGYVSLTARDAFDVEYWPLELYKLSLAPPEKELARRIALVTGRACAPRSARDPRARTRSFRPR